MLRVVCIGERLLLPNLFNVSGVLQMDYRPNYILYSPSNGKAKQDVHEPSK